MLRVGVGGASGYIGLEVMRLCASHPEFEVVVATAESYTGTRAADLYPSLAAVYSELVFTDLDPAAFDGVDVAFLSLPHGSSQSIMADLRKGVGKVVDLGADFRLRDPALYPTWYGHEQAAPELLPEFAFGIPELFRADIEGSDCVAAAGCYVTAAALGLKPLIDAGLIETSGILVDAASGISGAGRSLKHEYHFGTANEDFTAYGLLKHRHTPEIEQAIGGQVLFTPHLAPMSRGLLATCYARPGANGGDPLEVLRAAYGQEPFMVVSERSPSTKATLGSNCVHLTARRDDRTGWIVVLAALDNLVKGGAGQMIQCANAALGFDETLGLPLVATYP